MLKKRQVGAVVREEGPRSPHPLFGRDPSRRSRDRFGNEAGPPECLGDQGLENRPSHNSSNLAMRTAERAQKTPLFARSWVALPEFPSVVSSGRDRSLSLDTGKTGQVPRP